MIVVSRASLQKLAMRTSGAVRTHVFIATLLAGCSLTPPQIEPEGAGGSTSSTSTDDGALEPASSSGVAPSESSTGDEETSTSGQTSGQGSSSETGEESEDSSSSEDTGSIEGVGCGAPPTCDKGELTQWTRIETEADIALVAGYTTISNNLEISESNFVCLDFLACAQTIDGDLTVFGNASLVDYTGLDGLTEVSGFLVVSENGSTDMNGLNGLQQVGSLAMQRNETLSTVSGFNELAVIQDTLTIRDHPVLEGLEGFTSLSAVGGEFVITHNPSLCLSKINAIGVELEQCGDTDQNQVCDGSTIGNDDQC